MRKWLACALMVVAISPAATAQQPPRKPRVVVTTQPGSEGQLALLLENLVAMGFDVVLGDTASPSATPVGARVEIRDGGSVVEVWTTDGQTGAQQRDDVIRAVGTGEQERRDAVTRAVESLRASLIPVEPRGASAAPRETSTSQQPNERGGERHGLSLKLLVGGGYSSAKYAFEGVSLPGYSEPVGTLRREATLSGPAIWVAAEPGWWISQDIVLGLELGADIQLGDSGRQLDWTQIDSALAWQVLALMDARLSEGPGFRVQGGAGLSTTRFLSSREDIGAADNIVDPKSVRGPLGFVGLGYDFTRSIGLVVRASYSRQTNANSSFRPLSVGLLLSATVL